MTPQKLAFINSFEQRVLELAEMEKSASMFGRLAGGAGKAFGRMAGRVAPEGGFGANWMYNRLGLGPASGEAAGRFGPAMNWLNQNKQTVKNVGMFGGSGLAGGLLDHGVHSYEDYQKRQAIRNMSFLNRLGLAARFLAQPDYVANLM